MIHPIEDFHDPAHAYPRPSVIDKHGVFATAQWHSEPGTAPKKSRRLRRQLGQALSPLGKALGPGLIEHAKQSGIPLPSGIADAKEPPTPEQLVEVSFEIAAHFFPELAPAGEVH